MSFSWYLVLNRKVNTGQTDNRNRPIQTTDPKRIKCSFPSASVRDFDTSEYDVSEREWVVRISNRETIADGSVIEGVYDVRDNRLFDSMVVLDSRRQRTHLALRCRRFGENDVL